jgi:hypothetical protein
MGSASHARKQLKQQASPPAVVEIRDRRINFDVFILLLAGSVLCAADAVKPPMRASRPPTCSYTNLSRPFGRLRWCRIQLQTIATVLELGDTTRCFTWEGSDRHWPEPTDAELTFVDVCFGLLPAASQRCVPARSIANVSRVWNRLANLERPAK